MPASAAAPSTSRNSATTPTMIDRRLHPDHAQGGRVAPPGRQLDGEVGREAGEGQQDHQHGDHDVEAQGEGEGVLVEERAGGRLGLGVREPAGRQLVEHRRFGVSARAQM